MMESSEAPPSPSESSTKKRFVRRALGHVGERLSERVPLLKRVPRGVWLVASAVVLFWSSYSVYRQLDRLPVPGKANYFYQPTPAFSLFSRMSWEAPVVIGSGREIPNFVGILNGVAVQPGSRDRPARAWLAGNRGLLAYSEDYGRCWTRLEYIPDANDSNFGGFRVPRENPCGGDEKSSPALSSWLSITTPVHAASPELQSASRPQEQTARPSQTQQRPSGQSPIQGSKPSVERSPLQISPARLDFGRVPVGTEGKMLTIRVTNIGGELVTIENTRLSGKSGTEFYLSKNGCILAKLGPKESCSIVVGFNPSWTGDRYDSVFVEGTFPGEAPSIIVVGYGSPPSTDPTSPGSGIATPTPPPVVPPNKEWTPPVEPADLLAVEFDETGPGLAIAANGTIFRTSDGGVSWQVEPQRNGSRHSLRRVATQGDLWEFSFVSSNRQSTLARQTIRTDSDERWRKADRQVCRTCEVRSYLIRDGVGWAVVWRANAAGRVDQNLLYRRDAQGHWRPASRTALPEEVANQLDEEERSGLLVTGYWRLPPPWYLGALLLSFLLTVPALLKPVPVAPNEEEQAAESVEGVLASDKPLEPGDPDALGLKTIALGLSRFLRNKDTLPPLTIAINGEWGTGKSSLMNLLRRDLESYGFCPVWFNAWHHQKEEHLLAALLQSVRLEGVPPSWQLHGVPFRAKLLWYRLRSNLPVLVLLAAGLFFLFRLESELTRGGDSFLAWLIDFVGDALAGTPPAGPAGDQTVHQHGWLSLPWLSRLMALAAVLRTFWTGMTAFGANPAELLTTISGGKKLGDLDAQTSFRQRFASEFREVTEALNPRRPLVIFIDDLDRCTPGNVLQVLEAVNFLVTSGDCFVVMGLARGPVEGAVAYSLKDVASWIRMEHTKESKIPTQSMDPSAFARQYLDKLINIEVPVPKPKEGDQAKNLFVPKPKRAPEPLAEKYLRRSLQAVQLSIPVILVGFLFWGVARMAVTLSGPLQVMMEEVNARRPAPQKNVPPMAPSSVATTGTERAADGGTATSVKPSGTGSVPALVDSFEAVSSGPVPEIRSGHESRLPGWVLFSPVYLIVVFLLLTLQVVLTTRPGLQTRDSDSFSTALAIWHPLVLARQGTPRAAKRFVNRVRFLAMRQGVGRMKTPLWERVLFPERLEAEPDSSFITSNGRGQRIPESLLVALAAIELVDSDWVYHEDCFLELIKSDKGPSEEAVTGTRELFVKARAGHNNEKKLAPWSDLPSYRQRFLDIWPQITVR